MKIYFSSARSAVIVEGSGYYLPNTLEAVNVGGRVVVRQIGSALSELSVTFADVQDSSGASAGANISDVLTYLNTEFTKSGGSSSGGALPEYTTDPASPTVGQSWLLREVVNPAGTVEGFVAGLPVLTLTDQSRFDLSVKTTEGIRRLELK